MTDKQYEICKANKIKIYQLWIEHGKFRKKECGYEEFDKSWILRDWLNNALPYDSAIKVDFMYATENKINQCKKKLVEALKKDQIRIIKNAQKKLTSLEKIEKEI